MKVDNRGMALHSRLLSDTASCPFCGSGNTSLVELEHRRWVVVCAACEASGPVEAIPVRAREAWAGVCQLQNGEDRNRLVETLLGH